jgi:hypothetical protein
MCFFTRLLLSLKPCFSFQLINWINKLPKLLSFDNCILLCYYAASSGNSLPKFRDNLSVPTTTVQTPSLVFRLLHTSFFCVASSYVSTQVSVLQSQKPAVTKKESITVTFILIISSSDSLKGMYICPFRQDTPVLTLWTRSHKQQAYTRNGGLTTSCDRRVYIPMSYTAHTKKTLQL